MFLEQATMSSVCTPQDRNVVCHFCHVRSVLPLIPLVCSLARLIDADDHQLGYEEAWNSLAEGSQLPQGLTYLRLPEAPIPAALGHLIEGLTDLRHLECQGTDYYPSRRHTNLQVCPL